MRTVVSLTFFFITILCSACWSENRDYSYGCLFGGFGGVNSSMSLANFGAGGGVNHESGLGVSGELSYLTSFEYFSSGLGVVDLNADYHLLNQRLSSKAIPFVTGGYTMFFASGTAHGWNIGGGLDYWLTNRTGIRIEVRNHSFFEEEDHFIGVRAGFIFR